MASLSTLRTLFYTYLGTTASDPAFTPTTANVVINAYANKLKAEIQQHAPWLLEKEETLDAESLTSRRYPLPDDFGKWLEVRLEDEDGTELDEVRSEEIARAGVDFLAFCVFGVNTTATLRTSKAAEAGKALFLRYAHQPAEMVADGDTPDSWLPISFHDVIARGAAIDAYGLGAEQRPDERFALETDDRLGLLWSHIGRRGVQPSRIR